MAATPARASAILLLLLAVAGTAAPVAMSFRLLPTLGKCWFALVELEHCVANVKPEFLAVNLHLNPQCCTAIKDIEDDCLGFIFSNPVIGPPLSRFISNVCGALTGGGGKPPAAPWAGGKN